jgi:hypothetical protein
MQSKVVMIPTKTNMTRRPVVSRRRLHPRRIRTTTLTSTTVLTKRYRHLQVQLLRRYTLRSRGCPPNLTSRGRIRHSRVTTQAPTLSKDLRLTWDTIRRKAFLREDPMRPVATGIPDCEVVGTKM